MPNGAPKYVSEYIWGVKWAITESWFIFDKNFLDWQFDLSLATGRMEMCLDGSATGRICRSKWAREFIWFPGYRGAGARPQINNPLMRKWDCGRPLISLTADISKCGLRQRQPEVCPPESRVQYIRTHITCNNDNGALDKEAQPPQYLSTTVGTHPSMYTT